MMRRKKKRLLVVKEDDDEPKEEETPITSRQLRLATVASSTFVNWLTFDTTDGPPVWTVDLDDQSGEDVERGEKDETDDPSGDDDEKMKKLESNSDVKKLKDAKDLKKTSDGSFTIVASGLRGAAELIRWIFVVVGESFEDKPVLEEDLEDTIAGLLGETNHEHLTVEATFERLCALKRSHESVVKSLPIEVKNKEKLEWVTQQLRYVILPTAMNDWEKLIRASKGPYFVGSGLTLADIAITDFLDQCSAKVSLHDLLLDLDALADLLMLVKKHPRIAAYLDDRSDFDWDK